MSEPAAFGVAPTDQPGRRGDSETHMTLPETRDRLRQIARAAQLTYVEVDFARGRLRLAENFAAIMGHDALSADEVDSGRGCALILEHVVAADQARVDAALRSFLGGAAVDALRFCTVAADKRERYIEAVFTFEHGADPESAKGLVTCLDVTERQRIEKVLSESEARYRSALIAGRMGSWETDLVARTRTWSEEGMALFGLALPAGRGQVGGDADEYQLALHPDDRHLVPWFHALANKEDSFPAEYRIVRPDGTLLWLSGRGLVVSRRPDGTAHRLVSIMADVTERREAEELLRIERERLALALQAGQMGAYDMNIADDVLWWSPQTYKIFGVTPGSFEPTRKSVAACVHPDDRDFFLQQRAEAIAQHRTLQLEFRIVRPDGTVIWINHRGQTAYDAEGNPTRHYGIAMDITERRQVEQNLRDADRQKDNFVATLAHELRNPLAPIRNAVNLLRRVDVSEPRVVWCREVIDRQVGQMSHLLDDLLDLSRITRDRLELRREPVAFSTVMEHALEIAQPVINAAAHTLTIDLPPLPVGLNGDLTRLAQVFSNLLINAAKYTPAQGRIVVSARRQEAELVVSVTDAGIGITAEQMPHIFQMFGQVESALDRSQGGLGIGLSLAKRLVEMHGGKISAHSEGSGKGSEFVVRLPIASEAWRAEVATPKIAEAPSPDGTLRILIADDLRDSADSLAMQLESMGHQVQVAYDGEQALRVGAAFLPEVAFLDLGMPKLNGYETCRRIRQAGWGIQMTLVAQTGWGQEQDRQRTRDAGFDHHVVKPIDPKALVSLLETIAARSSSNRP